jgi:serine/threonine protein kinase
VHLLRQLCGSLAEAHASGLIHRDVKPANLMLTCRGGVYDFVKVLDFGLVKAFGGDQDDRLTVNHTLTGTPSYMSPEAISHPDTIDVRGDIYAVGAVGYFLLTKTPVFTGNGLIELCRKHIQEQPEPPSQRSGRPVSAAFERVLLGCLAKEREDRPASAAVYSKRSRSSSPILRGMLRRRKPGGTIFDRPRSNSPLRSFPRAASKLSRQLSLARTRQTARWPSIGKRAKGRHSYFRISENSTLFGIAIKPPFDGSRRLPRPEFSYVF